MTAPALIARARGESVWLIALFVVWVALMFGAAVGVWRYKTTPGESGQAAPARFPDGLGVARQQGKATIVMLAHPKCPCTRASLSELSRLMTELGPRAHAIVLFITPEGMPKRWAHTESWELAAAITGVSVAADENGALGARFGARTSGHTLVYDAAGVLVFSGGITSARGHAGDNLGRERILSALAMPAGVPRSAEVFGCSLDERQRRQRL